MNGKGVCYDCQDRWVTQEGRCHDTCERYRKEREKYERRHAEEMRRKFAEADAEGFRHDSVQRTKRHKNGGRKGG